MKIWKYTKLDAIHAILSISQFSITLILAFHWDFSPLIEKMVTFIIIILMTTYNIIVISHLFTHTPWFKSDFMNSIASLLNTINIGQSVQAYHLTHVRNHHRYNNDMQNSNGQTMDRSSTYRNGKNGEHASLFRYAFLGALDNFKDLFVELILSPFDLWNINQKDIFLISLMSNSENKFKNERRQLRLDRFSLFLGNCMFLTISWKWTLFCYYPAFIISLILVNIQNYYEHYGCQPNSKTSNSVSYYGKFYNLLTFNDGYHQEHHLKCGAHWSQMPNIRDKYQNDLNRASRIISPYPAIVGFLDYRRAMLTIKQENII